MSLGFRRWNKLAFLFKRETTYGVDALPAVANRLILSNVTHTPLTGDKVPRDLLLPYLGNQGALFAGGYAQVEGDLEIAGAGTAGTAPIYSDLFKCAGFAETITAGTKVEYTLVDDNQDSGSLYFVHDKVRYGIVGARVNIAPSFNAKGIPRWRLTVMGLLGENLDLGTMPLVSKVGLIKPLIVSDLNTTVTIHGWDAVAESMSINLGNTLTPRFLIGDECVVISDRKATASAVVEARNLATIDWITKAKSRVPGAVSIQHGTVAGNIVEHIMPAVEIDAPTKGQTDGIMNYSIGMDVTPSAGLDELKIVVR